MYDRVSVHLFFLLSGLLGQTWCLHGEKPHLLTHTRSIKKEENEKFGLPPQCDAQKSIRAIDSEHLRPQLVALLLELSTLIWTKMSF